MRAFFTQGVGVVGVSQHVYRCKNQNTPCIHPVVAHVQDWRGDSDGGLPNRGSLKTARSCVAGQWLEHGQCLREGVGKGGGMMHEGGWRQCG